MASAVRSEGIGDQVYYGVLASMTGTIGLFTLLTSWQPSRPVTVNHPGSVCKETAPATSPTAPTATPPTPTSDAAEQPPAALESAPAPPSG